MTIEERKDIERYIKERATDYFQRDRSGKGYICPICGSGKGNGAHGHGTGITENPKNKGHFTCWGGGCFENADIFEIIGKQFNLTDFNEIFNKACGLFGISLDGGNNGAGRQGREETRLNHETDTKPEENFTELFRQAVANLSMTDYRRGISLEE